MGLLQFIVALLGERFLSSDAVVELRIKNFFALFWIGGLLQSGLMIADELDANIEVDVDNQLVSLSVENVSLERVINTIAEKAGIKAIVMGESEQIIRASLRKEPIIQAVKQLSRNAAIVQKCRRDDLSAQCAVELYIYVLKDGQHPESAEGRDFDPHLFEADEPISTPPGMVHEGVFFDRELTADEVLLLAKRADEKSIELLGKNLGRHSDPEIRKLIVTMLGEIGNEQILAALEAGLGDEERSIRIYVIQTLGRVDSPNATRSIGQVLYSDPDPGVRLLAVNTLADQADETAKIFLEAATRDDNALVRETAAHLLEQQH